LSSDFNVTAILKLKKETQEALTEKGTRIRGISQ
jgi:hypothetical protein